MAAHAGILTDPKEIQRAIEHLMRRFPQAVQWESELGRMLFVKLTPKIVSVLDYTKGFGHTEQFAV